MKKRILSIGSILLLILGMAMPVMAQEIPEDRQLPRLNDEADLLTDAEEAVVLEALDEISERQEFDVVIATVEDFAQSEVKYAAYDYYDYNGFGYGEENDGVLLYISMAERDLNLAGTGFGITAFTDYGRERIIEELLPELGDDMYYDAFMEFASIADDFVTSAKEGLPYDVDHEPFVEEVGYIGFILFFVVIGLVVGLIIAFIIMCYHVGVLKNVEKAVDAKNYLLDGSFKLTKEKEYFKRANTVSRYIPPDDDDGGSTIDSGSSGVSHSSTSSKF